MLLEQRKSRYGIRSQFGSLQAADKKATQGGTAIFNIGPFGNQMVYSPPGLRFRMLLKNRVLFGIYEVQMNGKIYQEWISSIKISLLRIGSWKERTMVSRL
jgi:hypothetical protein